jgi:adenylate kinase family enzyme
VVIFINYRNPRNPRNPKKIHIIGSVGSGKTTLARNLSIKFNVPLYELDNVVWQRFEIGDIRRSDEERDKYLREILKLEAWIIEGVHHKWVHPSFEKADLIILLDTTYFKRTIRIIKRFILQKCGLEKANYKPTFKMFKQMFAWNSQFEKDAKPEVLKILTKHSEKVLVLKDNDKIDKLTYG